MRAPDDTVQIRDAGGNGIKGPVSNLIEPEMLIVQTEAGKALKLSTKNEVLGGAE